MNVINVVRKYLIQDLTGLVENYYIQETHWESGQFGCQKMWFEKDNTAMNLSYYWIGACEGGHLNTVKWLYKATNGEQELNEGLQQACKQNNMKLFRYLMKQADKEKYEPHWEWLLYGACKTNNEELIDMFMNKAKEDVYHCWDWEDALNGACAGGHIHLIKKYIQMSEENGEEIDFETTLVEAIDEGHLHVVEFLLKEMMERGVDYDIESIIYRTDDSDIAVKTFNTIGSFFR